MAPDSEEGGLGSIQIQQAVTCRFRHRRKTKTVGKQLERQGKIKKKEINKQREEGVVKEKKITQLISCVVLGMALGHVSGHPATR